MMKKDDSHCINTVEVLDWVQHSFSIDLLSCFHKQRKNRTTTKIQGVYELHGDSTEILWECPDKLKIAGTLTIHCTENKDYISVLINDQPSISITRQNASRSFTSSHLKKIEIKGSTPSTFSSGKYDITLHIQTPPSKPTPSPCYFSDYNGTATPLTCQATLPSNPDISTQTQKASLLIRGFVTVSIQDNSPSTLPIYYKTYVNMYAPKGAAIHAELSSVQVIPTIIPGSPEEELSYLYVNVSGKINVETLKKTNITLKGMYPPEH
ncbi:hypothetical protein FZC76_13825 [Sutcliffiella horikoshii]|uniref:Endospore appendages core domain-containing protein n=2 Tax=Sutcliffiella horikoshii TaxID=79883 RepID=A0A5D4SXF4_9BACI|nr:hypothetical protein FZC76_13825 [Sutcliffiella horikoshii]